MINPNHGLVIRLLFGWWVCRKNRAIPGPFRRDCLVGCTFYGYLTGRRRSAAACFIFIPPSSVPFSIRSWWPEPRLTLQGILVSEIQNSHTSEPAPMTHYWFSKSKFEKWLFSIILDFLRILDLHILGTFHTKQRLRIRWIFSWFLLPRFQLNQFHCYSGCSSFISLNRLFFTETITLPE